MKVTAETITDEQILRLKDEFGHGPMFDICRCALGGLLLVRETRHSARAICANAWNARARHEAKP